MATHREDQSRAVGQCGRQSRRGHDVAAGAQDAGVVGMSEDRIDRGCRWPCEVADQFGTGPRRLVTGRRPGDRRRSAVGGCQRTGQGVAHHLGAVCHEVVARRVGAAGIETTGRSSEGIDLGDDLGGGLDEPTEGELGHVQPAGGPIDRVEVTVRIVAEEVARLQHAEVRPVGVELVGVAGFVADPCGVVEPGHRHHVVAADDHDVGQCWMGGHTRQRAVADSDDQSGDLVDDLVGLARDTRVGVPSRVGGRDGSVAVYRNDHALDVGA